MRSHSNVCRVIAGQEACATSCCGKVMPTYSLRLRCGPSEEDGLSAQLWELGTTGILDEPGGLRAFFNEAPDLALFMEFHPLMETLEDIDWEQRTRDSFPALSIGKRFYLVPPWSDDTVPDGRIRLAITPGMACGTGWHPCTQMCLEALEQTMKPGDRVLDVGVGSGILSQAALLLGASMVIGCDVDEDSVRIAHASHCDVFVGSVDAVRADCFDLAIANISAEICEDLLPDLCRVARLVIASGFEQWPGAPPAVQHLTKNGWQCLVLSEARR